ncbi:phosphoglycerate mutase-like protein 4 [Herrania umbratica]|uniref:Phosphoglycerate mutase-like protein 4 n=1 Tax=Herrania umbratica TaxID=108875 RepID=A0A6J0ZKN4_9ROSI|nr:phosphoglycerate mutase-like protein 4 [Herrania umbratica]
MSAIRTQRHVAERRYFPRFSSRSVKMPVCVKFSATTTTRLHLHKALPTRHPTHLVTSPDLVPMSDSNSSCVDGAYAEIVVLRHGETEWNADGRIQGHLDVELNEAGRQQAASVADRLSKEPKLSAVYSSDLKRALVTAETIAATCGGLEVIIDQDLRERNLGDLQGLVFREAAKLNPKAHKAFLSHRTDQDIPGGGESRDQLYQRCTSSLQRIGRKHKGERVVVVSHGGVLRALYKRACPDGKPMGKVLNTSVNIFHVSDEEWTIKSWGDISHLEQTGYLKSGFGGDKTSG